MADNLSWTPEHAEERHVIVRPATPHHEMYTTTFRQIGWLGQSGALYHPWQTPDEPGGFTAIWIEVGG